MNVLYVEKEELYPAFGFWTSDGTIKIRKDLPKCVQNFLLAHETGHAIDREFNTETLVERELEANWYGARRHPWGCLITALMNLAPYRLRYYWQRWKEQK